LSESVLTTELPCLIHARHIPRSHLNHLHHVWPLGRGGPNIAANRVPICPTGHTSVHLLLDMFILHRGRPPYGFIRSYPYAERELAALGYDRITRGAM